MRRSRAATVIVTSPIIAISRTAREVLPGSTPRRQASQPGLHGPRSSSRKTPSCIAFTSFTKAARVAARNRGAV
jgi:hypothetical protein